jgi:hypothetical protein
MDPIPSQKMARKLPPKKILADLDTMALGGYLRGIMRKVLSGASYWTHRRAPWDSHVGADAATSRGNVPSIAGVDVALFALVGVALAGTMYLYAKHPA